MPSSYGVGSAIAASDANVVIIVAAGGGWSARSPQDNPIDAPLPLCGSCDHYNGLWHLFIKSPPLKTLSVPSRDRNTYCVVNHL